MLRGIQIRVVVFCLQALTNQNVCAMKGTEDAPWTIAKRFGDDQVNQLYYLDVKLVYCACF
jgi:hypothetical protein